MNDQLQIPPRRNNLPAEMFRFSPKAIMARPDELARLCDVYFRQLESHNPTTSTYEPHQVPPDKEDAPQHNGEAQPKAEPPTPAGLALGLGFSSVPMMLAAATTEAHPQESRHLLMSALTMIEDQLTTKGLMDRVNVPFAKFLLSARMGLSEKTEVATTTDTTIRFIVESAAPQTPTEQLEFDRITQALEEQTQGELMSMGRATGTIEKNKEPTLEDLF